SVRALPHDPRHERTGPCRSRPDPPRHAHDPRRARPAEQPRRARGLDSRPTAREAGKPDAADSAQRRGLPRPRDLPGEPAVSTTEVLGPRARERVGRLDRIWEERPGLVGWLTTVDHKRIGLLYFFTTIAFFAAGGVEALLMRTQLSQPDGKVLGPERYDQMLTMHGVTMIFLFVIPMSIGAFGNYLVPLMIGARDMAFPAL